MINKKEPVKKKKVFKKILLSVLGILLITIVVFVYTSVTSINKEYKSNEIVFGQGDKSALLIYEPSNHDTAKEVSMSVAQIMANHGYTVTVNYPSKELSYDWKKYDVIALGSPIYMGKVSPVLEAYVKRNPVENKKFLIYSMGALPVDDTTEIDEMNSWISSNNNVFKTKCKVDERATFESMIEEAMVNWDK
jgi:menaquinone-dependent protoporphyrinogen IX oxidase